MKAVVAAFNQEKALVGAFSVIVQLHRLIDLRHYIKYGGQRSVVGSQLWLPSTLPPQSYEWTHAQYKIQPSLATVRYILYLLGSKRPTVCLEVPNILFSTSAKNDRTMLMRTNY